MFMHRTLVPIACLSRRQQWLLAMRYVRLDRLRLRSLQRNVHGFGTEFVEPIS